MDWNSGMDFGMDSGILMNSRQYHLHCILASFVPFHSAYMHSYIHIHTRTHISTENVHVCVCHYCVCMCVHVWTCVHKECILSLDWKGGMDYGICVYSRWHHFLASSKFHPFSLCQTSGESPLLKNRIHPLKLININTAEPGTTMEK